MRIHPVAADLNDRHRPGDADEWMPFCSIEAGITRQVLADVRAAISA